MKLVTFNRENSNRLGIVKVDSIIDVGLHLPDVPGSLKGLLEAGDAAMDEMRDLEQKVDGDLALDNANLRAPVADPGKILAIGLNYADHVAESGGEAPKHQMWFNKQHNCANGPYLPIDKPSVSDQLDYEGEFCFVIGKRCRHVPAERAREVIAGYMVGNDVSVRDWQFRSRTMQIGKSFDTHGPMGPWMVTADEIGDPHNLGIKTWVNGELRQDSNTKHLIFNCFDQIEHLSTAFTLDPGDVIFTGTSSGVGVAMQPPKFLSVGDVVKIEVEKIGFIENEVVLESSDTVIE